MGRHVFIIENQTPHRRPEGEIKMALKRRIALSAVITAFTVSLGAASTLLPSPAVTVVEDQAETIAEPALTTPFEASFPVYFNAGDEALPANSEAVIAALADEISEKRPAAIYLIGYATPDDADYDLQEARTAELKDALYAAGLPGTLQLTSFVAAVDCGDACEADEPFISERRVDVVLSGETPPML